MKIVGIGVDIVQNKRIKSSIKNKNFIIRTFGKSEILNSRKNYNKVNFFSEFFEQASISSLDNCPAKIGL